MVTEARPLRGSLGEFNVVEILQMLGLGNMTGALHLHQPDGRTGIVYFSDGFLATCTELNTEALTLGLVLQQLGMATAEQLDGAYGLQTQDPLGKRIGELLVDYEIISPEQLQDALKTQLLWTVRELAQWQEGAYEFLPGEHLPAEDMPLRIEVTRVMMEVLRYTQEWDELQQVLPDGMRTRLDMTYKVPPRTPLAFDLSTWRVISHVNTHHTVRRIASAIRQPELEVARLIAPLVERDLLVPIESNSKPGLPIPARRLSMESFDLFSLLSQIEQEWLHRRQPADQLAGMALYINWTWRNLTEAYAHNGINLSSDTLYSLLEREGLLRVAGYTLKIQDNQIDVEDFTQYCRSYLDPRNVDPAAGKFHDRASAVLQKALRTTFQAINARIASPLERMQNQEAWEALFLGFQGEPPPQ